MRNVTYFVLSAYGDVGVLKYLYFIIIFLMYVAILVGNVLLIVVICLNRSLHEPMYIFLCSLCFNELFGSLGLFPSLLHQILQDVHVVSQWLCFTQIFFIYKYGTIEFVTLAVMSYDRFVAICLPLQYHTRMSPRKTLLLVALCWLYPLVTTTTTVNLTASQERCGNVIRKVYCDNHLILRLSCTSTRAQNIYGIIITICIVVIPLIVFLYTYVRILRVCFSGSRQTRQKALSTCTPHFASFINFAFGCLFEILQSRFDSSPFPNSLRIILSLYFLMCQPLFNPLMYGLKLTKVRMLCKKLMLQTAVNLTQNFTTSLTKK